jgi:hypothetical protein
MLRIRAHTNWVSATTKCVIVSDRNELRSFCHKRKANEAKAENLLCGCCDAVWFVCVCVCYDSLETSSTTMLMEKWFETINHYYYHYHYTFVTIRCRHRCYWVSLCCTQFISLRVLRTCIPTLKNSLCCFFFRLLFNQKRHNCGNGIFKNSIFQAIIVLF